MTALNPWVLKSLSKVMAVSRPSRSIKAKLRQSVISICWSSYFLKYLTARSQSTFDTGSMTSNLLFRILCSSSSAFFFPIRLVTPSIYSTSTLRPSTNRAPLCTLSSRYALAASWFRSFLSLKAIRPLVSRNMRIYSLQSSLSLQFPSFVANDPTTSKKESSFMFSSCRLMYSRTASWIVSFSEVFFSWEICLRWSYISMSTSAWMCLILFI